MVCTGVVLQVLQTKLWQLELEHFDVITLPIRMELGLCHLHASRIPPRHSDQAYIGVQQHQQDLSRVWQASCVDAQACLDTDRWHRLQVCKGQAQKASLQGRVNKLTWKHIDSFTCRCANVKQKKKNCRAMHYTMTAVPKTSFSNIHLFSRQPISLHCLKSSSDDIGPHFKG